MIDKNIRQLKSKIYISASPPIMRAKVNNNTITFGDIFCVTDTQFPSNQICINGKRLALGYIGTPCTANSDCGPGLSCINEKFRGAKWMSQWLVLVLTRSGNVPARTFSSLGSGIIGNIPAS